MTREDLVQANTEPAASSEQSPYHFGTWYPIETAPKDGTEIILVQDGTIEISSWKEEISGHYETVTKTEKQRIQEWVQTSSGYWDETTKIYDPTHWMPLPPAPSLDDRDEPSESTGVSLNKNNPDSNS